MAVRDDFTAGEVLAAADLNDTFASKPPFAYGTATPTTTVEGFIWYDENDTPPTAKFWDGSAFEPFSSGVAAAVFSNTPTGNYTDGNGDNWDYFTFNSSGTLTCTTAGAADVLIVSGGGGAGTSGGFVGGPGGGGAAYFTSTIFTAVAHTVTIGAGGGASAQGGFSGLKATGFTGLRMGITGGGGGGGSGGGGGVGSSGGGGSNNAGGLAQNSKAFGGNGGTNVGGGAGGDAITNSLAGIGPGISSDITGTAIVYGRGNWSSPGFTATANRGEGGNPSGNAGSSGVVVVRTRA